MAKLTELLTGSSKQNLLSTIDRGDVIKMKLNGVIKDLQLKNLRNDNSKIYLGISLEPLQAVWGQFSFR